MKTDNGAAPSTSESRVATAHDRGFWALDWLRFALGMYLVLFHTLRTAYPAMGNTWLANALGLGNWATSVFFVLSGFLLTHAYVVTKNGRPLDHRKFLLARFSTLYPLHLVALVIALVPLCMNIYSHGGVIVPMEFSGSAQRMLGNVEFFFALVTNILLLNAWNPYFLVLNYPAWSLSALAFFYLLFPVLAPRVYRMKYPGYALVLLAVLFVLPGVAAQLLDRTDIFTNGLLHRNPVIRLPLFVAGMVLCVLYSRSARPGFNGRAVFLLAVVVATAAVGLYLQAFGNYLHLRRNALYFPASLAIIWLCVCIRPTARGWLLHWGARLGAASLPMFLLHAPMFAVFQKLEKFATATIQHHDGRFSSIIAAARATELDIALYPVYVVALVVLCVLIQERFVIPVQLNIRNHVGQRKLVEVREKQPRPAA